METAGWTAVVGHKRKEAQRPSMGAVSPDQRSRSSSPGASASRGGSRSSGSLLVILMLQAKYGLARVKYQKALKWANQALNPEVGMAACTRMFRCCSWSSLLRGRILLLPLLVAAAVLLLPVCLPACQP